MSASGGIADVVTTWSGSPLIAEAVEKVAEVKIFETMIQNSGLLRINIAASAAHTNDSCAKFDGPDFFNSLRHKQTLALPKEVEHWSLTTLRA